MGRLLGGLFAAVVLTFCVASTANAAEIPPSAQCVATFKAQFKPYITAYGKASKKEKTALDRQFNEDLAAADCVTDVEPLNVNMPAKPFTEQCADAADDAQGYFGPANRKLMALSKPYIRLAKPYKRHRKALTKKIRKLEKQGSSHQLKVLKRERKRLDHAFQVKSRKFFRKMSPALLDLGYNSSLIIYEFISLRCIPLKLDFDSLDKGPAAKVIKKNAATVFGSVLYLVFRVGGEDAFNSSSSADSGHVSKAQRSAAAALLPPTLVP